MIMASAPNADLGMLQDRDDPISQDSDPEEEEEEEDRPVLHSQSPSLDSACEDC